MVLGDLAKDILDMVYEMDEIEYIFNIRDKKLYFRKTDSDTAKFLGTLSVEANSGDITFHKKEQDGGHMRKPTPSWGIHQHLHYVKIIKYIEYETETTLYRIKADQVSFLSVSTGFHQGEPKFYVPLKDWEITSKTQKPTEDNLTTILGKKVHGSWVPIFKEEYSKEYFTRMLKTIKYRRTKINVLPAQDNMFYAFKLTGLSDVKVVILGQDPYPSAEHPHGLAFSTKSRRTPASLRNIYKEIEREYPDFKRTDNDLTDWGLQGVLLLNTILTVDEGYPGSHQNLGWLEFTGRIIKEISKTDKPIVWMLWGSYAQNLYKNLAYKNKKHLVLTAGHPSPLSYKLFENCGHFKQCNLYLGQHQLGEIKW
jgi:uracil-DNA glycosylase